MVIGLLMLAAIPTVTGLSLGISERSKPQTLRKERARMKKFTMTCWCEGRSRGKAVVHGGDVVLGEGKMWIQSRRTVPSRPLYPFSGFYLDYPDEERPPPAPTGLVSIVSDHPPMMNWIYIDTDTWEVRHGNRTQSRKHWVGNFGWTSEEDEEDNETDPGGLVFTGEESFVALEPRRGSQEAAEGRWQLFWDRNDDKLSGLAAAEGRLVLRVSLERLLIEEEEEVSPGSAGTSTKLSSGQAAAATETAHSDQARSAQRHASDRVMRGRGPQALGPGVQWGE